MVGVHVGISRHPRTGFTPSALPAVTLDLRRGSPQWQDAGVTPAAALGDRVYRWDSVAGSGGASGTASDLTTNRLYRTAAGGVRGDGVASLFKAPAGATAGDFTVAARTLMATVGGSNVGTVDPPWSSTPQFYRISGTQISYYDNVFPGSVSPYDTVPAASYLMVCWRRQGGAIQYRAGTQAAWTTQTTGNVSVFSTLYLSNSTGRMQAADEVTDVLAMGAAITDAQYLALKTYWGV